MRFGTLFGAALVIAACAAGVWFVSAHPGPAASERMQLCATISPLADWVREVAGDDADVHCLVDGSKDPHHFEPSVQDAVKVSASRALFSIGLGLDPWADRLVANAGRGGKLIHFQTGTWIQPRKLEQHEIEIGEEHEHADHDGHHHEHNHGDNDPHFWHDPQRALVVVQRIALELAALDPAHKDSYARHAAECAGKLQALDARITDLAKRIPPGTQLVTFHDAFGYLFERLNVNVAAVVQVSPGVEPSLKDCAEALRVMREIKQQAIFKEPAGSDKAMELIAKDLGISNIEILDPLDNEFSPVGKDYFERMTHNIDVLEKVMARKTEPRT